MNPKLSGSQIPFVFSIFRSLPSFPKIPPPFFYDELLFIHFFDSGSEHLNY
nr:MAG TPA: hypothetical protein [Caudoviricetes sp.]